MNLIIKNVMYQNKFVMRCGYSIGQCSLNALIFLSAFPASPRGNRKASCIKCSRQFNKITEKYWKKKKKNYCRKMKWKKKYEIKVMPLKWVHLFGLCGGYTSAVSRIELYTYGRVFLKYSSCTRYSILKSRPC